MSYPSPVPVIDDSTLPELVPMTVALDLMEQAFGYHAQSKLLAPPRLRSEMQSGDLMFTCGAILDEQGQLGFRVYDLKQVSSPLRSEITPLFSSKNGQLEGLCVGPFLGAWRTGAIGGVIQKYLTSIQSGKMAIIGTGYQARTQLLAAAAALPLTKVEIYGRTRTRAENFLSEMQEFLAKQGTKIAKINLASSIQSAVHGADLVVTATKSEEPILEPNWLTEHVHVHNVGPKFKEAHEIPLEFISSCATTVTDSLQQTKSYDSFLLNGTAEANRLQEFSQLLQTANRTSNPRGYWSSLQQQRSYCCSIGLAGSELFIAREAIRAMREKQNG
ncbi:alanine dehydrogenase [Polystyrenella longa]|uniref:Alanine dehydrogenase n=1 Tax=Polystyrenella longa TaxID=2528007 RepID=A0A518CM30_9PLAN|nr:ornithine cyclodeaminase family protein [Polystyrenella longa]QDU80244.1 alanine dehydrogenase [Polystyrenella longa]